MLSKRSDYLKRDPENSNVVCGKCSARGHALIDCIWTGPFGNIDGCPLCNTTQHRLDDCREFHGMERERWISTPLLRHLSVVRRAHKPPILTMRCWPRFESTIRHGYQNDGFIHPVGHPWTKPFAMKVWRDTFKDVNKQFWPTYDYTKNSDNQSHLQAGSMTRDWETILQNDDLILEDQRQHGWNVNKTVYW
ncbi:hypothetical protein BDP55DRAFT_637092 [Colletotrichum godetiae]|uniref:Uncharacterized protein n=1 Tax=Colletotrichum godetiae TaxID=1209918 RepID=A0AAJ0A9V1_9PEZI|nr:uncharacterized protein BDP55DRAFT_637092 [Colletotrichum godetiae]KAK1659210.1 hypothetical protein BDP55DRAFT_637092 [Colletotrichum godetiae]